MLCRLLLFRVQLQFKRKARGVDVEIRKTVRDGALGSSPLEDRMVRPRTDAAEEIIGVGFSVL